MFLLMKFLYEIVEQCNYCKCNHYGKCNIWQMYYGKCNYGKNNYGKNIMANETEPYKSKSIYVDTFCGVNKVGYWGHKHPRLVT